MPLSQEEGMMSTRTRNWLKRGREKTNGEENQGTYRQGSGSLWHFLLLKLSPAMREAWKACKP